MKEVAEMKEKMVLYEAISVDYDSEMRESMEFDIPGQKNRVNKSQSLTYREESEVWF